MEKEPGLSTQAEAILRNTACIYCTFVIWVCFFFFGLFFLPFLVRLMKAVNFSHRHCTVNKKL